MSEELEALKRIEELLKLLVRASLADAVKTHLGDKKNRLLYALTGEALT